MCYRCNLLIRRILIDQPLKTENKIAMQLVATLAYANDETGL